MRYWGILLLSSVLEAVWATALGESHGLTRPVPSAVFAVAMCVSMAGLAVSLRGIAVGTAYAVWTGLGGAFTVTYAMLDGAEPATAAKVILLTALLLCVVGLNLVDGRPSEPDRAPEL